MGASLHGTGLAFHYAASRKWNGASIAVSAYSGRNPCRNSPCRMGTTHEAIADEAIFDRLMGDGSFRKVASDFMLQKVYQSIVGLREI